MANRKHIPYKEGQILYGPKHENGDRAKVKIIKHNSDGHYRIAAYYIDSHSSIARIFSNLHYSEFDSAKLTLGLSGLLKRL